MIKEFNKCDNCGKYCCGNKSEKFISSSIITKTDFEEIKKGTNFSVTHIDQICDLKKTPKTNSPIYTLKRENGSCLFFKDNKCSIHSFRPFDCRLFPLDIHFFKDRYFLIKYQCSYNINIKEHLKGVDFNIIKSILPLYVEMNDTMGLFKNSKKIVGTLKFVGDKFTTIILQK